MPLNGFLARQCQPVCLIRLLFFLPYRLYILILLKRIVVLALFVEAVYIIFIKILGIGGRFIHIEIIILSQMIHRDNEN